jgi:hypothetical protein
MNAKTPASAGPKSRMKRKTLYIAATMLAMLAYAVLLLLANEQSWLVWPALGAALLGVVFACLWVTSLDEAAQQAHYIAWFWGGNAGLLASMLVFLAVVLRPHAFEGWLSGLGASDIFGAGIVLGVVPAVLGYGLWWAVLWLRRG